MAEKTTYHYPNESYSGCDMVATILIETNKGVNAYSIGELQTISYSIHQDRRPVRSIGNINAKDYVMGPRTIAGSLVFTVFNTHFLHKLIDKITTEENPDYAFLVDELPPFNIIMSFANEYGLRSKMVIYGVRLINEGQVMSINDVYTENTYQFVATDIEYMKSENGYSRNGQDKRLYTITGNDGLSFLDNDVYWKSRIKKPSFNQVIPKMLRFKVIERTSPSRKGTVNLWLEPGIEIGAEENRESKLGKITITSGSFKRVIKLIDAMDNNGIVPVQLDAGTYKAIWTNSYNEESNYVDFIINNISSVVDTIPAPIVEGVSDDFIKIRTNYKMHNYVAYVDAVGNTYKRKLHAFTSTVDKLSPNTQYRLYTCNQDESSISPSITVSTVESDGWEFDNLLKYLKYNRNDLNNIDFNLYETEVREAKKAFNDKVTVSSVTESFEDLIRSYVKIIKEAKPENYPSEEDYLNALKVLENKIVICKEILEISTTVENDKIFYFNYRSKEVNPPVIVSDDNNGMVFEVDNDIVSLEFYRMMPGSIHFEKEIRFNNFIKNGDKYLVRYHGREDQKYFVYAVNKFEYRSSKVEFFYVNNDIRSQRLVDIDSLNKTNEYELGAIAYNAAINDSTLTDDDKLRIYKEILKSRVNRMIKAPLLIDFTYEHIDISIEEIDLINKIETFAVISESKDVLIKNMKYKIPSNGIVSFDMENSGVKPDTVYYIWIEDIDGNQLSECISVRTLKDIESESDSEVHINSYFVNDLIDGLKQELIRNNLYEKTVEDILFYNRSYEYNNKVNILSNILNDILDNRAYIQEMYPLLNIFFKYMYETSYTIVDNILSIPIKYSKHNSVVELSEATNVTLYNITLDGVNVTTVNGNIGDIINCSRLGNIYTVVSISDKQNIRRSGFMLINHYNNDFSLYRIQVEVGE